MFLEKHFDQHYKTMKWKCFCNLNNCGAKKEEDVKYVLEIQNKDIGTNAEKPKTPA